MVTQLSGNDLQKGASVSWAAMLGLDDILLAPEISDRFFFASPLIAQRLAIMNRMVGSRNSLVIAVLGEKGSGKTTLINRFIADKRNHWQAGWIRLKPGKTTFVDTMPNLHNRRVFFSRKSDPSSIIVDDAHQLSEFELRRLLQSAFAADGRRKLQSIVLFAELSMRDRFAEIESALPSMSGVDKMFMAPLTERQTATYLEHRIRTAGFLEQFPFSSDQIRAIHQASKGLPGWINIQAVLQLKRMYAGRRSAGILSLKRWILPRLPRFRFLSSH